MAHLDDDLALAKIINFESYEFGNQVTVLLIHAKSAKTIHYCSLVSYIYRRWSSQNSRPIVFRFISRSRIA